MVNYGISTDTLVVISTVDCGEFNQALSLIAVDIFQAIKSGQIKE